MVVIRFKVYRIYRTVCQIREKKTASIRYKDQFSVDVIVIRYATSFLPPQNKSNATTDFAYTIWAVYLFSYILSIRSIDGKVNWFRTLIEPQIGSIISKRKQTAAERRKV